VSNTFSGTYRFDGNNCHTQRQAATDQAARIHAAARPEKQLVAQQLAEKQFADKQPANQQLATRQACIKSDDGTTIKGRVTSEKCVQAH
jgi:hypothetical protein